ncbi:hypothetical protein [Chitinophaga sp.]|uniref:hypothetical protein n=1 Tax=Chitinophaga sp. TaxID=1869181 RepID=UPI002F928A46
MKKLHWLILILYLSGTNEGYGQYDPGATMMIAQNNMLYNNTIQSFVNQNIINNLAYANTKNKPSGSKGRKIALPANADVFRITPDNATSIQVKQAIINNLKKKDPVSGQNLERALNQHTPFAAYIKLLTSLGLDVQHNYADAFTAYMLGMWRIANRQGTNPSAPMIQAVRRQIALTVRPDGWNNRQKQEAMEYMIYELIFANEPYESSRKSGDKKQMMLDSDAVQQRFLSRNNMDLRNMIITNEGMIKKK